ncbi:MAG TPA: Rne/Rng family ribonuclease [Nocardioides sp.]|nr:Rne/Rng family ribonuclease [Nocardioides sp.]
MTDAPTENPIEAPAAENSAEAPASAPIETPPEAPSETPAETPAEASAPAAEKPAKPAKKAAAKKAPAKKTTAAKTTSARTASRAKKPAPDSEQLVLTPDEDESTATDAPASAAVLFQAPKVTTRKRSAPKPKPKAEPAEEPAEDTEAVDEDAAPTAEAAAAAAAAEATATQVEAPAEEQAGQPTDAEGEESDEDDDESDDADGTTGPARRRRRRGGRRRRKPAGSGQGAGEGGEDGDDTDGEQGDQPEAAEGQSADSGDAESDDAGDDTESSENGGGGQGSSSSRRRRRRRRAGEGGGGGDDSTDDPENTVTRVRKPRSADDEITSISGSTRLEAKKQRRREGREAGRRRAPIVSEAEFLARRESVERVMAVRQRKDLTQIAVLEDKVLVEHYVARESQTSLIGNVYLGRVQNVLPSMEAAFIDIGKGRNAVLYAGEVNWSALGHKDGQPRKIESVLQSGQTILVQVSKDPIGHKGARLTSQISLAGRFLVYVPDGTTSGISRKLPDTERSRLKNLLKEIVPDTAGVIVRTAAEGASEDELTRDVERLKARWEDIESKVAKGNAPQLLYGEPDLTLKVVRDLFTEDFAKLVVQGDDAWSTVKEYVDHVAPDLVERLERHDVSGGAPDLFSTYRIDEQIAKGLDRKVWLPSGGSLIIDRTEAMTVVDVNTGKFTGSGGNLEETVTKNNLEAAEEIVRQLRLRDIGGIIVVDFIDMVLESNRDLVLRRLVECLGRDRTRHQVAEVTSLGLVQMTRKRIGTGLLEAFSETCSHCQGRGIVVHDLPVESKRGGNQGGGESEESRRPSRRKKGGRGQGGGENGAAEAAPKPVPSPKDVAAMAKHHDDVPSDEDAPLDEVVVEETAPVADEAAPVVEEAPVEVPEALEEPAAEEPAAEQPVAEEPAAEEPVAVAEEQAVEVAAALEEPEAVVPEPEAVPEPEPAAEPVATTTVVTRTRTRRSAASRPAGPPAAVEAADGAAVEVPEVAAGADASADEPHVEHVPIKKKGARKR